MTEEEEGGGWTQVKRLRGRHKVRARRKGGREGQAGSRDGAVILTEQITGNGNGTNEAPRQHAWGKHSNNRVAALPQEAAVASHGGG